MPKAGAIAGRAETSINSINITRKLNQRTKFAKENVLQNLQNVFMHSVDSIRLPPLAPSTEKTGKTDQSDAHHEHGGRFGHRGVVKGDGGPERR